MKGKMKAIVKKEPKEGAILEEVDIPQIGAKEILVKVLATSICGSDYHIYSWDEWSQSKVSPPNIMGHEFSGEVVEVGSEVKSIKVGDNVSSETHFVCGHCEQCKTGNGHICKNTIILGIDVNGTFAEYVAIPEKSAWINPKNVDPAYLAVQEPLGNAVHTILSGDAVGKSIAVVGCGPIGALGVAVAKSVSPSKLIVIELNTYRINLAKKLGADVVINPLEEDPVKRVLEETNGMGVDVVAEMSGNPTAIRQTTKYIKPGGRISLLGLPTKEVSLDIANDVIFKGITIQGIVGRRLFETWYKSKGLIESGNLNLEPVITHRFPLEKFEEAFELMKKGNSGKIVLYPDANVIDKWK